MIEAAALSQAKYLSRKPEAERKEQGQYFTVAPVANYMASMIEPPDVRTTRILDAGAGAGILTISTALRCLDLGRNHVHSVLYEVDGDVIPHLHANMQRVAQYFRKQKGKFTFEIRHKDFVLARPDKTDPSFHISLINPPYFKYNSKTSPYAGATADLFKGNPNIYASFMAVVTACLSPNGQMVSIVPRSFTNGLYFKGFRHYLNQSTSLEKLHTFRSRDKLFKEMSVLQENIICSHVKRSQDDHIEVLTTTGYDDFSQSEKNYYSSKLLIDKSNSHEIIRVPETEEDAEIIRLVESWPSSFKENGYFISTGPVVEHRLKEYITTPHHMDGSVPLLRMHNVKPFKSIWTGNHKKDARLRFFDSYNKHTSKNQPYVLLKRFSSKDEKRRLVAGVHDPREIRGSQIALENHLNYISRTDGELSLEEAYGLAVLFNSTLMDRYFRCISGSTQVNATEIRLLKIPAKEVIYRIGYAFLKNKETDQQNIDRIVSLYLELRESAVA